MRALTATVVAAFAAIGIAGSGVAASTSGQTALNVTYWANGVQGGDPQVWTLRCNPPRGTLPHPVAACRRLATGGRKLVAPVPSGSICTEIYGGPQVARVVGFVQGKKVWAGFTRENGCQISRWNRLAPWLVPTGGASS